MAAKEFADHVLSARLLILLALLGLVAVGSVYSAATALRAAADQVTANQVPALFLKLFTIQSPSSPIFAFYAFIAFLGPLLGIAFGFDAINGERADRTLPRLLAQPIHRDDVINGKFVAGLSAIALVLGAITLIVAGVGLFELGVVPDADQVARLILWFVATIIYVGFWLAFAMLCSVVLRRAATSALASIGLWLVLTLFASLLVGVVAGAIAPLSANPTLTDQVANAELQQELSRISPGTLYGEVTAYLLDPGTQSVDIGALVQAQQTSGALPSILPFDQSLILAWPQGVALIALTVVCFGAAYVGFMRQEVRA
ncbi:MAG: ABC transporter permease [Chloroflexota bacterium]|nr:MAG: ABC transporter permease [Chloroflexota bacterium]